MLNSVLAKIGRIENEELIWLIYIFLSGVNLYSANLEEENITKNDKNQANLVYHIDITVLIIVFIIYLYFVYVNYKDFKTYKKEMNNRKTFLSEIALIGSIFFVIGGALTIYVTYNRQLDENIALE